MQGLCEERGVGLSSEPQSGQGQSEPRQTVGSGNKVRINSRMELIKLRVNSRLGRSCSGKCDISGISAKESPVSYSIPCPEPPSP